MRSLLCLALVAATSGFAHAKLELRDVQFAHGQLGPERKSAEFVQGDEVYVRLVIAGSATDKEGFVRGELSFIVHDAKKKPITGKVVIPLQQQPIFGADAIPGFVTVYLPRELPTGEYTIEGAYKDLVADSVATFEKKFSCKAEEFAIVALRFFHDEQHRVPAPVGGLPGQTLHVRLFGVGFDRSKGEVDVQMKLEVLDAAGKPVSAKPLLVTAHDEDPARVKAAPNVRFVSMLTLNRPGNFILRITLTDTVAKKSTSFEAPLRILTP